MSLLELEVRDLLASSFFDSGSDLFATVYAKQSNTLVGGIRPFVYVDRTDQFVVHESEGDFIMHLDPQFDAPATTERNRLVVVSPAFPHRTEFMGQFDRASGVQRIYGTDTSSSNTPVSVVGDDFHELILEPFPALGREFHPTFPSSQVGYYDSADDGGFLIFENWKGGTALATHCRVRPPTGGILADVFAEIDLATGFATIVPIPVRYQSVPANEFQRSIVFGDSFEFRDMQFVPDDDDSPTAPKGFLFLWTARENGLSDPVGAVGTVRVYFKFVDFNPTSKPAGPGSPSRVHLRETLFSRWFLIEETPPASGGIGEIAGGGNKTWNGDATFYHPPTRTIRQLFSGANMGMPEDQVLIIHSQIPALATVGGPSPEGTVETGKTTSWQITLKGDLGEPVPDLGVAFDLKRASSIAEPFDTSSGTETDVTVANPPIDAGTLVFKRDGVPLTLTTDYTVVEATGVITGVGAHAPLLASGYTADYEHRTVPVAAPHGSLVGASAESDQDGVAETRVRYPFDATLDNELEEIEATVEDQV